MAADPRRGGPPLGALLSVLALALCGACARPAPPVPPPPPFPFPLSPPRSFLAGPEGLVEAGAARGGGAAAAALPASQAPRVAALAALASPGEAGEAPPILVALNRFGLARIEASPDGAAYRVTREALPRAFAGRSVGGLWPRGATALLQLYRDPFAETDAPRPGALLFSVASAGLEELPAGGPEGSGLFAFHPRAPGTWLASFRSEKAERADFAFVEFAEPLPGGNGFAARPLGRAAFEAALAPRPLAEAPAGLRNSLLPWEGKPLLVRERDTGGGDRYWLRGAQDAAAEILAWTGRAGTLALDRGGEASWAATAIGAGAAPRPRTFTVKAPREGAAFTSLAWVETAPGKPPLVAAAWEAGDFPLVEEAGLLVFALP